MTLSSGIQIPPPEVEEHKIERVEKVDKPEEGVNNYSELISIMC